MSDVTIILEQIKQGDRHATSQLLPLVYDELRRLARRQLTREAPGQTLEATALVHEAYVRLVRSTTAPSSSSPAWDNRAHFYVAAAEAMRRILIEAARKKKRRGGPHQPMEAEPHTPLERVAQHDVLDIDEALVHLALEDPKKAQLVKLRFYAGLSLEDAAHCLDISRSTADRYWAYARAWLFERLDSDGQQK